MWRLLSAAASTTTRGREEAEQAPRRRYVAGVVHQDSPERRAAKVGSDTDIGLILWLRGIRADRAPGGAVSMP